MKRTWEDDPVAEGVIYDKVKPYTRVIKGQWQSRATDYKASQARIGTAMLAAASHLPSGWRQCPTCKGTGRKQGASCARCKASGSVPRPRIEGAYRFGLAVWMPTTAAGELPVNAGDWDNFVKAFLDAAQDVGLVDTDGPRHFRGPADVGETPSGVYVGAEWRFEWAFYRVED